MYTNIKRQLTGQKTAPTKENQPEECLMVAKHSKQVEI